MSWYDAMGFLAQWSLAPEKTKACDPATHSGDVPGWVFIYGKATPADQLPPGCAYEMKPIGIRWTDGCEELTQAEA